MRDFRSTKAELFIFVPLIECYTEVRYLMSTWMGLEIGRKRKEK